MTGRGVRRVLALLTGLAVAAAVLAVAAPAGAAPPRAAGPPELRVATFNASLNRAVEGGLVADLSTPEDAQAGNVAEIVQRVRPDVLLVNELDHDPEGSALRLFQENYLGIGRGGALPISYPYAYAAPSNTGVPSGLDLNRDGTVGGPDDAYGFGFFPGQYGMAVYSRYPIDVEAVRTFRLFRWADMPGARLPVLPGGEPWFSPEALAVVRLSSKSHWDVPIRVGERTVHLLASHPTPPAFDGPERRNKLRNFDEIRLWADYVRPGPRSSYIYDDDGVRGGLPPGSAFVIAGDLNSDPFDGDSEAGAIQQLLHSPRVFSRVVPASAGAVEAAAAQGGANLAHRADPRHDTADFADVPGPGNLRVDYVLPSVGLRVAGAGVFWPPSTDPLSRLTGTFVPPVGFPSSDHRLVWVDLSIPGAR